MASWLLAQALCHGKAVQRPPHIEVAQLGGCLNPT
jgi:hypothetical protein